MDPRQEYLRETLTKEARNIAPRATRFETRIEVGSIVLTLRTDHSGLTDRLRAYFARYLSNGAPQAVVKLVVVPDRDERIWVDESAEFLIEGHDVFHRDFAARRQGNDCVALVTEDLDDSIHNLLRWFLPPLLLQNNALLLHAAGVERDGVGYVFFGQSGAGKSTSSGLIAEHDPQAEVFGDDSVILRIQDGLAQAYSAPLGCGYSRLAPRPACVPLAGLFALEQSHDVSTTPLTAARGAALLVASTMFPDWMHDGDRTLELALRFAQAKPCVKLLRFSRQIDFWKLILEERKGVPCNEEDHQQTGGQKEVRETLGTN